MPNKIVIILNLLALGLIGILTWQVRTEVATISQINSELATLDRERATASTLSAQMAASATNRAAIDSYFINSEALPRVIESLETLATSTRVSFNLENAVVGDKASPSLKLDWQFGGSFNRVMQFLTLVENLPYQVRLDRLQLSAGSNAGDAWQGSGTLEILSFVPKP